MALTKDRAYSGGRFGLELDGVLAGWVFKVSGGGTTADVVSEKIGPDHVIKKHLGGVNSDCAGRMRRIRKNLRGRHSFNGFVRRRRHLGWRGGKVVSSR